jgi:hypothetical protein
MNPDLNLGSEFFRIIQAANDFLGKMYHADEERARLARRIVDLEAEAEALRASCAEAWQIAGDVAAEAAPITTTDLEASPVPFTVSQDFDQTLTYSEHQE